jgi:hypothetical protein
MLNLSVNGTHVLVPKHGWGKAKCLTASRRQFVRCAIVRDGCTTTRAAPRPSGMSQSVGFPLFEHKQFDASCAVKTSTTPSLREAHTKEQVTKPWVESEIVNPQISFEKVAHMKDPSC